MANDFGVEEESINQELDTLNQIETYLNTIGHPEEWWLAEGKTEIFTEIGPLLQACETNAVPFEERSKLIRSIYQIIINDQADYRLIRDIRSCIGPLTKRRGARRMPSVTGVLIENAPNTATLRQGTTNASKSIAGDLVDKFHSEFDANKDQEKPLIKAERAESNLKKLVEILQQPGREDGEQKEKIISSLSESKSLAENALSILKRSAK